MYELAQALIGESAHTAPSRILAGLSEEQSHRALPLAPHTIYQELWHIAFWQQVSIDWISGIETPYPVHPDDAFPSPAQASTETFDELRQRYLDGAERAAAIATGQANLEAPVRCPSRPGFPVRVMTVEDQLISLAAHNSYHFGRIVLSRQMLGAWPPPGGGFTW